MEIFVTCKGSLTPLALTNVPSPAPRASLLHNWEQGWESSCEQGQEPGTHPSPTTALKPNPPTALLGQDAAKNKQPASFPFYGRASHVSHRDVSRSPTEPFHRVTLESRAAPRDVTPLNSICWYCANSICWEQIWIPMPATIYISDPATEQHSKGSSKASRVHSRGCRNSQSRAPTQNLAAGVRLTGRQCRGTATSDHSPRRPEGGKWHRLQERGKFPGSQHQGAHLAASAADRATQPHPHCKAPPRGWQRWSGHRAASQKQLKAHWSSSQVCREAFGFCSLVSPRGDMLNQGSHMFVKCWTYSLSLMRISFSHPHVKEEKLKLKKPCKFWPCHPWQMK